MDTLTATVYSEAGGVGKTTITANVAVALARRGLDVLVIDLDPQEGSLSYLLDVADDRDDPDVDSLVRHLIDRPRGAFEDLIRRSEGVDVVPAHNSIEKLPKFLRREKTQKEDLGERWNENKQLIRVLKEAEAPATYDAILIDPPATADVKLYNAIHATRHVIIPFEASGKGTQSVAGLEDLVDGLETTLGISVGVLALVPNRIKDTRDQQDKLEAIEARGFPIPVAFRERVSLLGGCWDQQCSAFRYVDEHRDRKRDYEQDTLEKFETLADHLIQTADLEAPTQEVGSR